MTRKKKLLLGGGAAVLVLAAIGGTQPAEPASEPIASPPVVALVPSSSPTKEPTDAPTQTPTAEPSPTPEPTFVSTCSEDDFECRLKEIDEMMCETEPITANWQPDGLCGNGDPIATPEPVSYAKLSNRSWQKVVRSPDDYLGDTFVVWGCVTQFDAATGPTTFLAQASNRKLEFWYSDGDNAIFTSETDGLFDDVVEDDIVQMNVASLGSISYDTQIGGNTTVPAFEVEKVRPRGSCE